MNISWSIPLPGPFRLSGSLFPRSRPARQVRRHVPMVEPQRDRARHVTRAKAEVARTYDLAGHVLSTDTPSPGRYRGSCSCGKWSRIRHYDEVSALADMYMHLERVAARQEER